MTAQKWSSKGNFFFFIDLATRQVIDSQNANNEGLLIRQFAKITMI